MSKLYKFTDRDTIEKEAAAWLTKLDGDFSPSKEDMAALTEWLGRSPVHRQELNSFNAFWGNKILTKLVVPVDRGDMTLDSKRCPPWMNLTPKFIYFSAACVLLLSAVLLFVLVSPSYLSQGNGLYATAVGQQKTLRLTDGSTVLINTDTQLQVDFGENYRDIRLLKGEAFFTVAENTRRPFRVHIGSRRVLAVGTAFSVYMRQSKVDIVVIEGRVALTLEDDSNDAVLIKRFKMQSNNAKNILDAGQVTTIKIANQNSSSPKAAIEKIEELGSAEINRRLSWRQGLLIFNGDRLDIVVKEISRYDNLSIEIPDPAVRALRIGGQFRVGDTEAMLSALEASFGLKRTTIGYQRLRLDSDDSVL